MTFAFVFDAGPFRVRNYESVVIGFDIRVEDVSEEQKASLLNLRLCCWLHTLRQKCICARVCAHMQRSRSFFAMKLLQTYLESCASIVQAVVCQLPSCHQSPDAVRSRSPSKFTLAHDAVAAAFLHKYSIMSTGQYASGSSARTGTTKSTITP